ncbi:unnamed protein product, partial [Allacma fusca]
MLKKST